MNTTAENWPQGIISMMMRVLRAQLRNLHFLKLRFQYRHAPNYASPTETELEQIESDLKVLGIPVQDYYPEPELFRDFQAKKWFPEDYHGGVRGGAWNEKLLEHWISSRRLELADYCPDDTYLDIAAASSPWARILREQLQVNSFAIDLCEIGSAYRDLPYYRVENATKSTFPDASIKGATLHCAYEMFLADDDTVLIHELARILKPGGKVIVLPLYMHTHYCTYSTPEYFGRGHSDPDAKEYIQMDIKGVPSSRKYDAQALKHRVLDPIIAAGLSYQLLAIRNKSEFGSGIYCHFILEIER